VQNHRGGYDIVDSSGVTCAPLHVAHAGARPTQVYDKPGHPRHIRRPRAGAYFTLYFHTVIKLSTAE